MIAIGETRLFIGGAFVDSVDGATFETRNPATGEVLADVAEAREADVNAAVAAAQRALDGEWGTCSLSDRAAVLRRLAGALDERKEGLAKLESLDAGKPIRDCVAQVELAVSWFDWFADTATKLRSHVIPGPSGLLNYTLRQPHGVVGCIVPWNYPLPLYGIKVAPALAMGNAVLLKPAEQAPLTALALAEITAEVGLPAGALNVLPGYPTAGRAIVEHPGVRMVSFTGSTDVGRDIAARAAPTVKKLSLELGGKSPNVIFADAELDLATSAALFSFCVNQGQLCSAGTRLLVEDAVHDDVLGSLVQKAERLKVGDPSDAATQLGAVISEAQLKRIESYVESGVADGASVVTGAERPRVSGFENGLFYAPTIFDDVDNRMRIAQEEIFGPVLSVIRFEDEQDAVTTANDVMYGLAAGIWTRDLSRAHRLAAAIDAGLVYVNTMNVLSPASPYSGFKASGFGAEGGFEQCAEFTQLKSVWINLTDTVPEL
jgi:acyl-CoA reductase-like NAD-dependent aldehyde dehydrogenase